MGNKADKNDTYTSHTETDDFLLGKSKWDYTPVLKMESGEEFLGLSFFKYIDESDEDAIKRELNKSYEEYVAESYRIAKEARSIRYTTMPDYCELALSFIESEEMRECFRNTLLSRNPHLIEDLVSYCCDFIIGSRASIKSKLSALRKMPVEQIVCDLIDAAESALSECKSEENGVFLATMHFHYDTGRSEAGDERKPFLTFESVEKWIAHETALYKEGLEHEEEIVDLLWYEVEKFIPDTSDELQRKFTWTLNALGEIVFFELDYHYAERALRMYDWEKCFPWQGSGNWEYPPVPFDFGDIITIDMRPFYKDIRGVIVSIGDNYGCCAIKCIYADKSGLLYCNTLKHDLDMVLTQVSPLYRAKRYDGELPENEKALKTIADAIKKIPSLTSITENGIEWKEHELAEQFTDYLYSMQLERKWRDRGCSWDEFKEHFKL